MEGDLLVTANLVDLRFVTEWVENDERISNPKTTRDSSACQCPDLSEIRTTPPGHDTKFG
ncbi:hypothetical protein CHELA17_65109 [Chelatococcus asaccharovorans]|nr:hypothetical protein CHELA17_65109 [Chelatococcus asaccharovorans]